MLIKKLSDQVNEYACALAEVTKELHLLQTKRVPTAALSTSACEARAQATANVQSKQPPSAQTFQSADFEICSEDPAVVTNDWFLWFRRPIVSVPFLLSRRSGNNRSSQLNRDIRSGQGILRVCRRPPPLSKSTTTSTSTTTSRV